jgi:glycosyltransferase involved in cell wall biosynthesis
MGEPRPPGGCEIYRGNMPAWYLMQNSSWLVDWLYYADIVRYVGPGGPKAVLSFFEKYDLIVFPRFYAHTQKDVKEIDFFFKTLRRLAGLKIAYEVDDDFTNRYRQVLPEGASAIDVAKLCDGVTVSTKYLGTLMERETGRPCYVLPNMIDPALWKLKPNGKNDLLRIGLTGSTTHYNDWIVLKDVMPRILKKHPHVEFVLGAFAPDYFGDLPRTHLYPPLAYPEYAETVKTYDIVLAPLNPKDRFNLSKSAIKAIEGMGACRSVNGSEGGAAVIATDVGVYRSVVQGRGVLVPHTPKAWFEAIDRLITDADERKHYQINGYNWVWKNHDIAKGWKLWDKAYRRILNH